MINKSDIPILALFFLTMLKMVHNIYKTIKEIREPDSVLLKVFKDIACAQKYGWPEEVNRMTDECIKHSKFIREMHTRPVA